MLKMPGFSFLELQGSSYFHCADDNIESPMFVIIFIVVFASSPLFLALFLHSRFRHHVSREPRMFQSTNHDNTKILALDILNIQFITPINPMFYSSEEGIQKYLNTFTRISVASIPIAINIVTIIVYAACIPQYQERWVLVERNGHNFKVHEVLIDYIFVNVMYVLGSVLYITKFWSYLDNKVNTFVYHCGKHRGNTSDNCAGNRDNQLQSNDSNKNSDKIIKYEYNS